MKTEIKNFALLSIILLLLDSIYLSTATPLFNKMINNIQGSDLKLNFTATIIDYLIIVFSIYYFIIVKNGSLTDAALLGFCIYGIYEFTNLAIIKNWQWKVALVDTLWGTILYSLSVYIFRKLT